MGLCYYNETPRLILRTSLPEDASALAAKRSADFVKKYNLYKDCDSSQMLLEIENYDCLTLIERESGDIIGSVSVRDDVFRYHTGALLLHAWLTEGTAYRGYMLEALVPLMRYLFENKTDRISVQIFSGNIASAKLAGKLGFVKEGCLKDAVRLFDGSVVDLELYSVDKKSFFKFHSLY